MRRAFVCLCILLTLAIARTDAFAASSLSGGSFSAAGFDAIGVTPFDPAVGTLNSVNVTIDGTLTVSGTTSQNIVMIGLVPTPSPYTYQVSVTQDFFGLIGEYFDFDSNAVFTLPGVVADGLPVPFTLATSFSYGFTFTGTTDLLGFIARRRDKALSTK